MDYTHVLPHAEEEFDYLAAFGRRERLKAALSASPDGQDKPIALRQQAAYVNERLVSIGSVHCMRWAGETPIRRVPLGLIEAERQLTLALIAVELAGDTGLMDMLRHHIRDHDLVRDRFMMQEAVFDIFHMPHGLIFGWSMDSARRMKLCKHLQGVEGGQAADEIKTNNPPAALGVMLTFTPASNHDRLAAESRKRDMTERYQLISTGAFGVRLTIKAPGTLRTTA